jgi:hypothetical protein
LFYDERPPAYFVSPSGWHSSDELDLFVIAPAIKYLNIVIPPRIGVRGDDQAGIQVGTGCRIKSGMTELPYIVAGLIF